tara:strand:- start:3126 stop:3554 length:429 start_codon:yes stop_codon:yes gene_type:complete
MSDNPEPNKLQRVFEILDDRFSFFLYWSFFISFPMGLIFNNIPQLIMVNMYSHFIFMTVMDNNRYYNSSIGMFARRTKTDKLLFLLILFSPFSLAWLLGESLNLKELAFAAGELIVLFVFSLLIEFYLLDPQKKKTTDPLSK